MNRAVPGLGASMRKPPPAAARSDRVVFVGPMPPDPTGIATYDVAVLDGLRRIGFLDRIQVDVIWPVRGEDVPRITGHRLGIFQMGNHIEFHRDVYRLAHHMPALVTLHDVALDDFVIELQMLQDPLAAVAVREAAALRGRMNSPEALANEPLRDPWCAALTRAARGIVVHSDFGRRYLESFGCRTPVFVVPHPATEGPADVVAAEARGRELRAPLEAVGARTIVLAPGDMNRAKCLDQVVAAVARLDHSVHLALVGRRVTGYDPAPAIKDAGMGQRVTVAHDVSDRDFLGWIAAADVVVDLRYPHRGEVSGSLARAMQVGRPAIVSGTGTYLDLPDDTVVRVAAGEPDAAELAAAILTLADDPHLRARIGDSARTHVARLRDTDATAHGYAEAVDETLRTVSDPAAPARDGWARALAEMGLTESELALGHGLAYARALDSFRRSP